MTSFVNSIAPFFEKTNKIGGRSQRRKWGFAQERILLESGGYSTTTILVRGNERIVPKRELQKETNMGNDCCKDAKQEERLFTTGWPVWGQMEGPHSCSVQPLRKHPRKHGVLWESEIKMSVFRGYRIMLRRNVKSRKPSERELSNTTERKWSYFLDCWMYSRTWTSDYCSLTRVLFRANEHMHLKSVKVLAFAYQFRILYSFMC